MRIKKDTVNIVSYIFRFSLLTIFVIGLLSLTIVGINSYRSINHRVGSSYEMRSSLSYVATKIRQNDRANSISIATVKDIPVLILSEIIEDKTYETRIYSYQGALYEDFSESSRELKLGNGQAITETEGFAADFIADNLLEINFGENDTMVLSIQSDSKKE